MEQITFLDTLLIVGGIIVGTVVLIELHTWMETMLSKTGWGRRLLKWSWVDWVPDWLGGIFVVIFVLSIVIVCMWTIYMLGKLVGQMVGELL